MTYSIDAQNEADYPVDLESLRSAAETVLVEHSAPEGCGLTIVITDNDTIKTFNQQFRGIDTPTDVLSFPAGAPPVVLPDEPPYLGDLIIAYPYAITQAEREGHNPADWLALLVIHGALHLLGYDHDSAERQSTMWAAQEKLLLVLGITPKIVPGPEMDEDGPLA